MNMSDQEDGSESDPESFSKVSDACREKASKRRARFEEEIAKKKRKCLQAHPCDLSVYEPFKQSLERTSINAHIFPGGSGTSSQSPHSTVNYPPLDSTIANVSESSSDLIPFRNLEQSLQLVHNQPNSGNKLYGSSSFAPSYVFRNLLYATDDSKAEKPPCEGRIFQPDFPMDDDDDSQQILENIEDVSKKESVFNDPTSTAEGWPVQQSVNKEIFQNPPDQDSQNYYDWDRFLERWEGLDIIPEPTGSQTVKRALKRTFGSVPFNGEAKKRKQFPENTETPASSPEKEHSSNPQTLLPSSTKEMEMIVQEASASSPEKEHGSNPQMLLPSTKEMEMIVRPVLKDASETSAASKLEKFIKNTKIKLLQDREMPPLIKKLVSLSHGLPIKRNGSLGSQGGPSNLLKTQINVEDIAGEASDSHDKIEELTSDDSSDTETEMVS